MIRVRLSLAGLALIGAVPVATLLSRRGCSRCGCQYLILGGAYPLGFFREGRGAIGALPGELGLAAAKMPVGRGLLVDRPHEVQHLAQPVRCQVEVLADDPRQVLA